MKKIEEQLFDAFVCVNVKSKGSALLFWLFCVGRMSWATLLFDRLPLFPPLILPNALILFHLSRNDRKIIMGGPSSPNEAPVSPHEDNNTLTSPMLTSNTMLDKERAFSSELPNSDRLTNAEFLQRRYSRTRTATSEFLSKNHFSMPMRDIVQ
ncbi:hypothetical protein GQX74_003534 [Glossina fuscipes]|nr:hypothetical protein GQX74_003534 [Glossina fuscipes]